MSGELVPFSEHGGSVTTTLKRHLEIWNARKIDGPMSIVPADTRKAIRADCQRRLDGTLGKRRAVKAATFLISGYPTCNVPSIETFCGILATHIAGYPPAIVMQAIETAHRKLKFVPAISEIVEFCDQEMQAIETRLYLVRRMERDEADAAIAAAERLKRLEHERGVDEFQLGAMNAGHDAPPFSIDELRAARREIMGRRIHADGDGNQIAMLKSAARIGRALEINRKLALTGTEVHKVLASCRRRDFAAADETIAIGAARTGPASEMIRNAIEPDRQFDYDVRDAILGTPILISLTALADDESPF